MRSRWLALGLLAITLVAASVAAWGGVRLLGRPFPGFLPFVDGSVSLDDQPSWAGPRAGLRYLDRIVSADGQPVTSSADVQAAVERAGGAPVTYQLLRGDTAFVAQVTPERFRLGHLLTALVPIWLMGAFLSLLGVVVAWLKPRAAFTLPFTVTCVLAGLAFFGNLIGVTLPRGVWIFAVGYYLLPAAIFHLGLTFPETGGVLRRAPWLLTVAWIVQVAVLVVYLMTLGTPNDPTTALHLFTQWVLLAGFAGLIVNSLWTLWASTSDLARTRARLLAIGMAGAAITVLALAVAARSHLTIPLNVAAAPLLLFPVSMGLGIAYNDLFQVDLYVRRAARLVFTLGVLAVSYLVLETALRVVLAGMQMAPLNAWVPLGLAAGALLISERLRGSVTWLLERVLYPRAQQMRLAQAHSRELFGTAGSEAEVSALLLSQLTAVLGVRNAALFVHQGEQMTLLRGTGEWLTPPPPPLQLDGPLVEALRKRGQRIGLEELLEARLAGRSGGEPVAALIGAFERAQARLASPLFARDRLVGVLLLGDKLGRAPFNALDEELISAMSASAALALEDAHAYEQIAALNRGLESRVEERTRELHEANQQLLRATQFKSEFIRSVSHELRTPLNAILGFTELVLQRERGLSAQSADELGKVRRNAQSLLLLIEDLLDLGRIEAGRFQLKTGECDLGAVAREACAAVEPMARAKGLRLVAEGLELPPLRTDEGRVRQILVNLLGNAVKYTPTGMVALRGRIESNAVALEVWDTGPGIPADQAEAVFGEFVQLEGASQALGSGLGLAIARKLARLLGGDVTLKSTPGSGSCFTLRLPLQGRLAANNTPRELPALRRTVLAVTEDPETIVRVREVLGQGGFEVTIAFDAQDAVARSRESLPFAVALDGARLDAGAVTRALVEALGGTAPPSLLLPTPLEGLLSQLKEIGDGPPAPG